MAGAKRVPERRQISLIDFPDEILLQILLLLPPKSILRCRAVCKPLRRLVSDRAFLLAHHHRQPARRLVSFVRDVGFNHDLEILDYCVEALDFRTHEFRSVVRFTGEDYSCVVDEIPFVLHAVCDGLLLMSYQEILYICNPATREWASVFPPTLPSDMVVGLYAHVPSGDYRVLYCKRYKLKSNDFFISNVGSNNQRHISGLSSAPMRKWLPRGSAAEDIEGPTVSHGNLHWLPHNGRQRNILVFDTTNEIFRLLLAPVTIELGASLLEIDGMLAMSNSHGESYVDLWLLQDYRLAVWVRKYRVELPVIEFRRFEEDDDNWSAQVVSREGDVLVDGFETVDWQFHYDRKGNLLKRFLCDGRMLKFTQHILRESLVPHAIFQNQQNRCTCEPPFFRGL